MYRGLKLSSSLECVRIKQWDYECKMANDVVTKDVKLMDCTQKNPSMVADLHQNLIRRRLEELCTQAQLRFPIALNVVSRESIHL